MSAHIREITRRILLFPFGFPFVSLVLCFPFTHTQSKLRLTLATLERQWLWRGWGNKWQSTRPALALTLALAVNSIYNFRSGLLSHPLAKWKISLPRCVAFEIRSLKSTERIELHTESPGEEGGWTVLKNWHAAAEVACEWVEFRWVCFGSGLLVSLTRKAHSTLTLMEVSRRQIQYILILADVFSSNCQTATRGRGIFASGVMGC